MPQASATMVRKKSMVMLAKMRGVTSLRMGSTPRARMASICSVTTIDPSSLAIEEALRPLTMTPVSIGPNSRIMVSADKLPGDRGGAKGRERSRRLQRQHAAGGESGEHHDRQRAEADDVGLNEKFRPVDGRAKEIHKSAIARTGSNPAR